MSKTLVTIGACATAGGIQALRNFADVDGVHRGRLRLTAIHLHARDLDPDRGSRHGRLRTARLPDQQAPAARGDQRLPASAASPASPSTSVCTECKRRGTVCVMVAHGTPCLGPVTHAGCGALCPAYNRGCFGCFGPMETPNTDALDPAAAQPGPGRDRRRSTRVFQTFNAAAEPFRKVADAMSERRTRSGPTTSRASRARARCTCGSTAGRVERRASCGSSSRRASSRRSCAAARSPRHPTSPRGSAGSVRSPTR